MPTVPMSPRDPMAAWAVTSSGRRRSATSSSGVGQLRFAFYGRTSTSRFQDPASSIGWQREAATELIAGRGVIAAEYVDVGYSRRVAWQARPQAAALLKAVASPHRRFDAIVVGEYERAFTGRQLIRLLPYLAEHGVQMWLPEFDGPIHSDDSTHEAVMLLLGSQSKREVTR